MATYSNIMRGTSLVVFEDVFTAPAGFCLCQVCGQPSWSSVNKQHPWKKRFSFRIGLNLSCYWGVASTSPLCTSRLCRCTPTGIYWNNIFSKFRRHQMSHRTFTKSQSALGRQGIQSDRSFCHSAAFCLLSPAASLWLLERSQIWIKDLKLNMWQYLSAVCGCCLIYSSVHL